MFRTTRWQMILVRMDKKRATSRAREPVGLDGLVIYKNELWCGGHVAGNYGPGKKSFLHRPLS